VEYATRDKPNDGLWTVFVVLPTVGQTLRPELIQFQPLVKMADQPTGSLLLRPMQFLMFYRREWKRDYI
jgi:hypothetical protein